MGTKGDADDLRAQAMAATTLSRPAPEVDVTMPASAVVPRADESFTLVDPDHYSERSVLTQGGMGRIVTARDRRLGRRVAIKELRAQVPELRARFEREALLTARLEHPSIVSIHEAGRWPSGEPFYAMRLVPGRSFDQVIGGAKSLADRLALLPHVIAIADALAYAHQQRVIHRDLKPHNVMVGEFGETIVIDWGLAKDLTDADADPTLRSGVRSKPSASTDGAETTAGEVLGTPSYMPPEQANGDAVDERADVYSIGAILYHLLAGTSPYGGRTTAEVLEGVRGGPPKPLREREDGIPPDLLAIVDRAMARTAADRYPSARELADDLRRFQAGQLVGAHRYSTRQLVARWLRRHRTPVAITTVALLVLTAFGAMSIRRIVREEQRADTERRAAQAHRADAEELMDFMLVELKFKLEKIGKVDVLDTVASKALDYYAKRPIGRTAKDRHAHAVALRNLGDVLRAQNNLPGALARYRDDLAIHKTLVAEAPSVVEWSLQLGVAHDKVGKVLWEQGDIPNALIELRAGLAVNERVATMAPDNIQAIRGPIVSHTSIGEILVRHGDVAGALVEYRAALAVAKRLAERDPASTIELRNLAASHDHVGWALRDSGDAAAALVEHRAARKLYDEWVAREPDNTLALSALGTSHSQLSAVLLATGDVAGGLAELRAGVALSKRLVAHDPNNASWQRDLAVSHLELGSALLQRSPVESIAELRAALAISETLVARDPSNAVYQSDVAAGHGQIGDILVAQGAPEEGLVELRRSLEGFVSALASSTAGSCP